MSVVAATHEGHPYEVAPTLAARTFAAQLRSAGGEWRARAACRGSDPDLFFSARGDTSDVRKAKAVCAGCLVREPCLRYALEAGETIGTWGGTTPRQRRQIRAASQRAKTVDTGG